LHEPQRPGDRPLVHRDADGRERTASDWESLTERLIREAQQAGRFDDLPGRGRPLRLPPDEHAGEMAMAFSLLRDAGAAPPWIETDKQVRALRARLEALIDSGRGASPRAAARLSRRLEALADEHDDAVRRLESLAPTPRQQRRRIDREAYRARLAAALGGGDAAP